MRPNQLKWPYSRVANRCVLIEDRVWFVPEIKVAPDKKVTDPFQFPGWDHSLLFGNNHPVHVEYCSGNGHWIIAKALEQPQHNWVAVEKKFDRVRKIWSKMKNAGVNNLVILCGEGMHATQHYMPAGSVNHIYINFPDPWPKTRHHKNRIVQLPFVQEVRRIMAPGSYLTMVTDDDDYSNWMGKTLKNSEGFDHGQVKNERENYGTSFFEDLWRSQGKTIYYHQYTKVA